ncbi:MAG: hypothetical protein IH945_13330 [Armatimonadetes bacterium]|nr:hypothetical protein [Armatimonadota bacterium]
MRYGTLIGLGALCALTTVAGASDAGHLAAYVKTMNSAAGLDVTYSVNEVGGSMTQYRVVLSRPDKALIVTPFMSYYADGKNLTSYNKRRNTYFVQDQSDGTIKGLLSDEHFALWRPFFDPKAFDDVEKTKNEGTRRRRGVELKIVSAQMNSLGDYTIRLHLGLGDNLVRQAEFLSTRAPTPTTRILTVDSISTDEPVDDVFAFSAPAGAVQLTEHDLRVELITSMVSYAETERTDPPSRRYKPVQPENMAIAEEYRKALIEEFTKYPIEFIKASNLQQIVLVEQLQDSTIFRAATPASNWEILYYDVTYFKNEPYARKVMHHEFYHMLEEEWNGDAFFKDPKWAALNMKGFTYGSGGASSYQQSENVGAIVHPLKGFVNWYSTYGLEEDKAVIWETMFMPELWKKVKNIASRDSIVRAKIDFLREFARSKCAAMDDEFWKTVAGEGG